MKLPPRACFSPLLILVACFILALGQWLPACLLALGGAAPFAADDGIGAAGAASASEPPEVAGAGAQVLLPLGEVPSQGKASRGLERTDQRIAFACKAGCSEREPELEQSLAPYAEWGRETSGLDMLELLWGFCQARRSCKDPFVITVLWQGDTYLRACGAEDLREASLYLIGPEDLSLVITFLYAVQRVAGLPPGPMAFGLYLSDYTCLVDRHLVGPGVPLFAYLGRQTSWAIPWPSSFTVHSTQQLEARPPRTPALRGAAGWAARSARAYWIGTITGPWELSPDADLAALPRLKLLHLARDHPEALRAEWSGVAAYGISWVRSRDRLEGFQPGSVNGSHSVAELTGLRQAGFKALEQWGHFKYYVNLDGVVMGGRLNKLMGLGGVVLQHEAGYREHIDALAKPYVHYVPVRYDLSDLVPKIRWLQANDREAERIASRAQDLAQQRMRLEDHLCYVWRALEGLGNRTASKEVNSTVVAERLRELRFRRVAVVADDMRKTLEGFWGAKLEEVATGDRVMTRGGIRLLQWSWDRFSSLRRRSQR